MRIGAFITITRPDERGDLFYQCAAQAKELCDVVTIIDGEESWPKEFDWKLIGHHFQAGYLTTEADVVLHLDTDFILHENDFQAIRQACRDMLKQKRPAFSMLKYQFILPDRYNLKSRLILAVNKRDFGNRIRFDSGGDLCQPSLDGEYLTPDDVLSSSIPFYNYEKLIKTKAQVMDDTGRMARAYQKHFKSYKLGGPSDEDAFNEWVKMQVGRFTKPQAEVPLDFHPKVMRHTIKNLTKSQWGYDGFGYLKHNNYVKIKAETKG